MFTLPHTMSFFLKVLFFAIFFITLFASLSHELSFLFHEAPPRNWESNRISWFWLELYDDFFCLFHTCYLTLKIPPSHLPFQSHPFTKPSSHSLSPLYSTHSHSRGFHSAVRNLAETASIPFLLFHHTSVYLSRRVQSVCNFLAPSEALQKCTNNSLLLHLAPKSIALLCPLSLFSIEDVLWTQRDKNHTQPIHCCPLLQPIHRKVSSLSPFSKLLVYGLQMDSGW